MILHVDVKQMDKKLRVGKVIEKYEKSYKSINSLRKVGKILEKQEKSNE